MRATLSHFYSWSHEDTGRLTPRQARGYYGRIIEVAKMFSGNESSGEGSHDIDAVLEEAEVLGLDITPGFGMVQMLQMVRI